MRALTVCAVFLAAPRYVVDTRFEAGSAGRVEIVSGSHIRVAVVGETNQDKRNRQPSWFYFRLDNAAGSELTIELDQLAGEYNYRQHDGSGLRNMRPVYSYDNKAWEHFESSEWNAASSSIKVRLKPAKDRVWIARQPPYTTAHLEELLKEIGGSSYLRREAVGKTVGGRPILLLTVTNPAVPDRNKKVIWLMARQHAWESGTSWVCEGALRFLVSADPAAVRIRDAYVFKIFPMADPDGVARGGVRFNAHGYDLNRNWDTADPQRMPEIFAQRKAMLEWIDGGGRMDLFLSLHNTESADFISGPVAAGGPEVRNIALRFSRLLDQTSFYAPKGPRDGPAALQSAEKGRLTVYEYLFRERKAPAFLMELMVDTNPKLSRPPTVADRLKFGAALVRCMAGALSGDSDLDR